MIMIIGRVLEETCCHSVYSKRPLANATVENLNKIII